LRQRFDAHVAFAAERATDARGALILMCGLSGSGKSWLAERLVAALPAVRIRSDVERKRLAGLAPDARSGSALDAGLYAREQSDVVYAHLVACATALLLGGEAAIVDATFLTAARREAFGSAAVRMGKPCVIVHCVAAPDVLAARIEQRARSAQDASEATLAVLAAQQKNYERPTAAEGVVITVDTGAAPDIATTVRLIRQATTGA
jgi:predicted kinase